LEQKAFSKSCSEPKEDSKDVRDEQYGTNIY